MKTLEAIERKVKRIRLGKDKIKPGQPIVFPAAASINDAVRQGDLYLVLVAKVPGGFVRVDNPTDSDRQLVPGNTTGAKHCLDSLKGVELWRPKDWSDDSLVGPVLRISQERQVLHPTHGAVTIPAGMTIACHYQREWDREQKKERRARD